MLVSRLFLQRGRVRPLFATRKPNVTLHPSRLVNSRSSVIARMGKPNDHAGGCGIIHFPIKECAIEYVYSHSFAPLVPEYYIVSFSRTSG